MSRLAYIGNFAPAFSTENFVATALEQLGHQVWRVQESNPAGWREFVPADYDGVVWTRTDWQWPQAVVEDLQGSMLAAADHAGVPTVGVHLDRWWGLSRESEIGHMPFFRCSHLFTADGGHDPEWARAGVNHHWMPPAVADAACARMGRARPEFNFDVVFVGSWQGGYHQEWPHRAQLIDWLRRFGTSSGWWVRFFPAAGEPAVRGPELNDLYASASVVVGDSCLAGSAERYWSDRVPETIGRGGLLLHPLVKGMEECYDLEQHLWTWKLGDWDMLSEVLQHFLGYPGERHRIATAGREYTRMAHTWTVRMREVLGKVGLS